MKKIAKDILLKVLIASGLAYVASWSQNRLPLCQKLESVQRSDRTSQFLKVGLKRGKVSLQNGIALRGSAEVRSDAQITETAADAVAFHEFLSFQGFECEGLELAFFGELRGMRANKYIAAGDCLLAFPEASTFDLARARTCPCPQLLDSQFWETCESWFLKMGLWLLAEELQGNKSRSRQ
jgi:hypothetical protein